MKKRVPILALLAVGVLAAAMTTASPINAQSLVKTSQNIQTKQPSHKIGKTKYVTGGLIQSFTPRAASSNKLQTDSSGTTLGASGTNSAKQILGVSSLPTLWNPLNAASQNYGQTTPVLNQNDLDICWDYAGVDGISLGAEKGLNKTEALLPAYYDYLSASNAFTNNVKNPLAIMEDATTPRKLGDGNTLDYVPTMSVLGYNPVVPSQGLSQSMTLAQDVPMAQSSFNSLTKSDLHVNDTYKITGLTVNKLPEMTNTAAIMNRANQIKQLVYQYGEAQFGMEAEYAFDYTMLGSSGLSSQIAANGNYTSYTPYSVAGLSNANYSY